jgi:hypothetical protein
MKKIKFSRNELIKIKEWVCDIAIANHNEDDSHSAELIDILVEKLQGVLEFKLSNLRNENRSIGD